MTKIKIAVQPSHGESKLKRVSQSFGCLLLFGALLQSGSCEKGLDHQTRVKTHMPVSIDANCKPGADPIKVKKGDPVIWSFSGNYTITLESKYDLNYSPP